MITSDRFQNGLASSRARLFSSVFSLPTQQTKFCLSFKYNIHGTGTDELHVGIENYADHLEFEELWSVRAPMFNRWFLGAVEISSSYRQSRVTTLISIFYLEVILITFFLFNFKLYFEPRRGQDTSEYASVSIDSINLNYGDCGSTRFALFLL